MDIRHCNRFKACNFAVRQIFEGTSKYTPSNDFTIQYINGSLKLSIYHQNDDAGVADVDILDYDNDADNNDSSVTHYGDYWNDPSEISAEDDARLKNFAEAVCKCFEIYVCLPKKYFVHTFNGQIMDVKNKDQDNISRLIQNKHDIIQRSIDTANDAVYKIDREIKSILDDDYDPWLNINNLNINKKKEPIEIPRLINDNIYYDLPVYSIDMDGSNYNPNRLKLDCNFDY